MEFRVHKHSKAEFYPIFCKWCIQHSFPVINDGWLPENCFVCSIDGMQIYCLWFWHTDSKLCMIGFPASNKNVNYKKRNGGLEYLLEYVNKYAKRKKYTGIFTNSGTEIIIDSLLKLGYIETDLNVKQLIKNI